MGKILIAVILVFTGSVSFSQENKSYMEVMRSALKTEKKAMVAGVMDFTQDESDAFWPLYNAYQEKLYAANTKYLNIVNEFAANFDNMTDEKALDLMNRLNNYEGEVLRLKKTYIKKFSKILPPTKVLRYFQAENKIAVLIDYEMAASIPLLETK
jgi:hypothetical protein